MHIPHAIDAGSATDTPLLIHHLVERAIQAHPERVAIVFGDRQITYRQLNERADALCRSILHYAPDADLIGVSSSRSIGMIISVLAILKAGKAYLPLDPAYPEQRLRQVVADAQLTTCLTPSADLPVFQKVGLHGIDPEAVHVYADRAVANQGSIAYVIYTSGSTGKPKGVVVGHRSAVHYLQSSIRAYATTNSHNSGSFVHLSLTFDASVTALFLPLLTGKLMVISSEEPLEVFNDANLIKYAPFDFIKLTPSQFYLLETATDDRARSATNQYVVGGSALHQHHIQFLLDVGSETEFINEYGPTETTVGCISYRFSRQDTIRSGPTGMSIGKPMPGVGIYVLDTSLKPVSNGGEGEIYIGGIQVAEGYLNQPALTNERFLPDPFTNEAQGRMYKSGDLARRHGDGNIEYIGRADEQVKIGDFRIELGEIESVLQQYVGVQQCVVLAKEDAGGTKRLVGYVVAQGAYDKEGINRHLRAKLPDYMVPRLLMEIAELPLTGNGKIAKEQLPNPDASALLTGAYAAPTTTTEAKISQVWKAVLTVEKVGTTDNFFELGGNSLLAVKVVAVLKQQYQYVLPVTKLYQYPTVGGIAGYLEGKTKNTVPDRPKKLPGAATGDVAVIGMAGRFPGAATIEELWTVLREGRETISFFSKDELDSSLTAGLVNDPAYVAARGIVRDADQFDAAFFGLNPKLSEVMDPQQRIFLEIAWEVLEQTGYLPAHYNGAVGVYAGCGNNTYYLNNIHANQRVIDQIGAFQAMTVNEKDYIASRTAYQLNLKGPAVSVYSACSTSLLAIAQAVDSIRNGQCDVALAGGSSVISPVNSGHLYQEGAILSRDGHCRSFDADASGTIFSDGAGVVLLKSREAAQRDGDTIYAVIKGVGVNNDGGGKGSFTAPSAEGQAGAIRMAIADARIDPSTIDYVEAHGTGTPLGDPIEIDGLVMAFGELPEGKRCAIGSIKSNMGHLTAAAGVAGFIKTTLALYHRQIPASIGFSTPNPAIDFVGGPFFVNPTRTDWDSSGMTLRRAGVSSFGVGGTNVHVVLEESGTDLTALTTNESANRRPVQLLTWSAKSTVSRDAYASRLADALTPQNGLALADVAFTLQTTRADFSHRRFAVAATTNELIDTLRLTGSAAPANQIQPDGVVFLFPGQGAQYLNMGRTFCEHETVFRQAVDDCAERLLPYLNADIRHVMYPETVNSNAEQRLKNTRYTQPALFVTEYALARLWMSWGIEPTILCGHSIGEFVAAHLAGVFSLTDALTLIAARGRMVSELPRGSMLSVRMDADVVGTMLPTVLSMAAINSRNLCVVAGPDEHVADFARLLDEKEIPNRLLATSHAFHSAMMDPIIDEFEGIVAGISLNRPQTPLVSTVTGTYLTDAQATDPHYWAQHLRSTVRFADALDTLFEHENPLLLEAGPGSVLTSLARQQAGSRPMTMLMSLLKYEGTRADYSSLLKTLGQLWMAGLTPDWRAFYAGQHRRRVTLPTYAFDRKRCWVDPVRPELLVDYQVPLVPTLSAEPIAEEPVTPVAMRKNVLIDKISVVLENASGIDMEGVTPDMSFLEIGLDSLLLTQVSLTLRREFGLPITFRQLMSDYATPGQLADYLDQHLPADAHQPAPVAAPVRLPVAPPIASSSLLIAGPTPVIGSNGDSALGLIAQQLQLLARQVALLQGDGPVAPLSPPLAYAQPVAASAIHASVVISDRLVSPELSREEEAELKKPFGATARIERQASGLTTKQHDFLQRLTQRYNQKTAGSKTYAQQNRAHMADPRVVSGFRPLTKEIVYPLVINRSKGSRLWDIDGNEYIDVLNGFGSNMFGYQPDLIKQALHEQVENGFEVGPQHELAGEVSRLICELTGSDRAALCSTGSEAVLGTMRLARTVTGRSLIVAFAGSYHGIVDEVIARGTKKLKSYPAAPGIMPESVQNMLILDYGTDESLRIIRERAHELAAVLVEPVQSRRPEFVPVDFLKAVRTITAASGTALIFDEIITGFRMHPGGTQALFGIKADLASYGKVVGAGLPIGVIAGKREFMDALDGGYWQYGDASVPEVGVTYFAGTFVRHPLALAAARASLQYMKGAGPVLQQNLTRKTTRLADAMNAVIDRWQLPFPIVQYGSLWKIKFSREIPYGELLFTLMREKGIHIWDGFPCFMTEAHTDGEMDTVVQRFTESIDELIQAGFFVATSTEMPKTTSAGPTSALNNPPVPGARLGRDRKGNPAWFTLNPDQPGNYLQVELT